MKGRQTAAVDYRLLLRGDFRMRTVSFFLALAPIALSAPACAAAKMTMICENSRREYRVRFEPASRSFTADDTNYRVLSVEDGKNAFLVTGLTTPGGPTFRAHFRPYRKMEFFADGQIAQTDGCR